ncbi:hypothetical protein HDU97_007727 [Phlyctochytrium planicorne]|nr:hypothetical protein HDU97_007727 [Phlyctochytrium planicorne]
METTNLTGEPASTAASPSTPPSISTTPSGTQPSSTEPPRDLTIYRSTTSNRLRANDPPHPDFTTHPLLNFLRLFLSVFTILSFAMATAPTPPKRNADGDGISFDTTINITVLGSLHWNEVRSKLKMDTNWRRPEGVEMSVLAVPALFGPVVKNAERVPILMLESVDACDPFTILLPDVEVGDLRWNGSLPVPVPVPVQTVAMKSGNGVGTNGTIVAESKNVNGTKVALGSMLGNGTGSSNHTLNHRGGTVPQDDSDTFILQPDPKRTRWFALIPRGNCPFDVKIYHAQSAGFSGAIIYNNFSTPGPDLPVRMSGNTLGDRISFTTAMFLTNKDGTSLQKAAVSRVGSGGQTVFSPLLVSIAPDAWPSNGWGNGGSGVSGRPTGGLGHSIAALITDLVILSISIFVVGIAFMSFYLVISMIRNYLVHGSMFVVVMHFAHQVESEPAEEEEKCLEKITLPLRIVTGDDLLPDSEKDLESGEHDDSRAHGGSRECCAICIDEFVLTSSISLMSSIDPWLLKHNRLCPICKRDVLAIPTPPSPTALASSEKPTDSTPAAESGSASSPLLRQPNESGSQTVVVSFSRWFNWRRRPSGSGLVQEEAGIGLERRG